MSEKKFLILWTLKDLNKIVLATSSIIETEIQHVKDIITYKQFKSKSLHFR